MDRRLWSSAVYIPLAINVRLVTPVVGTLAPFSLSVTLIGVCAAWSLVVD